MAEQSYAENGNLVESDSSYITPPKKQKFTSAFAKGQLQVSPADAKLLKTPVKKLRKIVRDLERSLQRNDKAIEKLEAKRVSNEGLIGTLQGNLQAAVERTEAQIAKRDGGRGHRDRKFSADQIDQLSQAEQLELAIQMSRLELEYDQTSFPDENLPTEDYSPPAQFLSKKQRRQQRRQKNRNKKTLCVECSGAPGFSHYGTGKQVNMQATCYNCGENIIV